MSSVFAISLTTWSARVQGPVGKARTDNEYIKRPSTKTRTCTTGNYTTSLA